MPTLENINHADLRALVGSFAIIYGDLTASAVVGNTMDLKTTAALKYGVNGEWLSKAATDPIDISALYTPTPLPDGRARIYLVTLDASGNFGILEGQDAASVALAKYPNPDEDVAAIGAVKVMNASGAPFVFGTTVLTTSGLTCTYHELYKVPA